MLLGLVLCGAGVLTWFLMLELGQRIHDKSSLHRAADAAAYSAAIEQARALNMHAYLNRAQLAHQIAMAHLIGAATASRFRSTLSHQAQRRNPPASLMGAFFGLPYSVAYLSSITPGGTAQFSQQSLKDAFLSHDRVVHHVLDVVRKKQIEALEQQQQHTISKVLVKNIGHHGSAMRGDTLSSLGLTVDLSTNESNGFVTYRSANDAPWRNFLTTLVGKYTFLDRREKITQNPWFIHPRCPLKRHELRRQGQLILSADGQWQAQETQSFHALRHNRMIGCYHREYPMGWANIASQNGTHTSPLGSATPSNFSQRPFWKWVRSEGGSGFNILSGRNNPLAQSWASRDSVLWQSKGLGHYAQITEGRERSAVRLGLTLKQRVSPDTTLTSVAFAQAYFAPPAGAMVSQRPSLFEPYWKATLIPEIESPDQRISSDRHTRLGEGK